MTTRARIQDMYEVHGDKLRFLVVGVWNTAFSYALFAALLWLLTPVLRPWSASSSPVVSSIGSHYYLIAQWLSWILSVPQSTISLKYLVFRSRGKLLPEIGRAYFVYLPMQGLSTVALWFLVSIVHLHPLLAQLITVGLVAILSYVAHKNFTFRDGHLAEKTDVQEPSAP